MSLVLLALLAIPAVATILGFLLKGAGKLVGKLVGTVLWKSASLVGKAFRLPWQAQIGIWPLLLAFAAVSYPSFGKELQSVAAAVGELAVGKSLSLGTEIVWGITLAHVVAASLGTAIASLFDLSVRKTKGALEQIRSPEKQKH